MLFDTKGGTTAYTKIVTNKLKKDNPSFSEKETFFLNKNSKVTEKFKVELLDQGLTLEKVYLNFLGYPPMIAESEKCVHFPG